MKILDMCIKYMVHTKLEILYLVVHAGSGVPGFQALTLSLQIGFLPKHGVTSNVVLNMHFRMDVVFHSCSLCRRAQVLCILAVNSNLSSPYKSFISQLSKCIKNTFSWHLDYSQNQLQLGWFVAFTP